MVILVGEFGIDRLFSWVCVWVGEWVRGRSGVWIML